MDFAKLFIYLAVPGGLLAGCAIHKATPAQQEAFDQELYSSYVVTPTNDTLRGSLKIYQYGGELPVCVELTARDGKQQLFTPVQARSFSLHLTAGMQTIVSLLETIQQRQQPAKTTTEDTVFDAFANPELPRASFFAERISPPQELTLYYFPDNDDTRGRRLTLGGNGSVSVSDKRGRNNWTIGERDFYSANSKTGDWTIGSKRVVTYRNRNGRTSIQISDALGQGYIIRRVDGVYCLFRQYDNVDFAEKLASLINRDPTTLFPTMTTGATPTDWAQLPMVVARYNSEPR